MTTYTTAALVRKRVEDIDASLVDDDIDQYILEAEKIIDCIMKHSLKQTFNAERHAIVRGLATDMAALTCVQFSQGSFASPHLSEMTANLLSDSIRLSYYLLNDPKTAEYLINTTEEEIMMKVSTTTVDLSAAVATTLYTVPVGQIFVPTMAVVRAGSNAAATDVTFGRVGALTDWMNTTQLDNLDAAGDQVLLMPIPADPALKLKTYAAGVVFQIDVAVAAGGVTNHVDLFGYLISE